MSPTNASSDSRIVRTGLVSRHTSGRPVADPQSDSTSVAANNPSSRHPHPRGMKTKAPIRAIYKPVSDGEAAPDDNDVVIFTIDGFHEGDYGGDDQVAEEDQSDHDPAAAVRNGIFEIEGVQPMDVSSYSLSDDDLSEQLFGWKDPWLPSIAITLIFTAPILLGNVWLLYDLLGALFIATPFVVHLIVALCVARHAVSAKLALLSSPKSRTITSASSL
jgi:hypothetical protein